MMLALKYNGGTIIPEFLKVVPQENREGLKKILKEGIKTIEEIEEKNDVARIFDNDGKPNVIKLN